MAKKKKHTYESYLEIEKLLSSQSPQTTADSELLFIIIHQVNELWFKLMIHEFENAINSLYENDELLAYKRLSRITQILTLLVRTWDVLTTLTPHEFRVFRETVGKDNASGFQSHQYRIVEFLLGLKDRERSFETDKDSNPVKVDIIKMQEGAKIQRELERYRKKPAIYDATLYLLNQRFPNKNVPSQPRNGDFTIKHKYSRPVYDIWWSIYTRPRNYMSLFQLGERLVDIEDAFRQWRFRHLTTVSRVIGKNTGTGGSIGLKYLQKTAIESMETSLFPEIWDVRNHIYDPK